MRGGYLDNGRTQVGGGSYLAADTPYPLAAKLLTDNPLPA